MKARVIVDVAGRLPVVPQHAAPQAGLGKAEFQGVCATCHGMQGQGGYGPALSSNSIAHAEARARGDRAQRPRPDAAGREHVDATRRSTRSRVHEVAHLQGSELEWRLDQRLRTRSLAQRPHRELARHRRPQADRDHVHRDRARLLRGRRDHGAAHARAARDAERAHPDEELATTRC